MTDLVSNHGGPAKIIHNPPEEVLADEVGGVSDGFRVGVTTHSPPLAMDPSTPTDTMLPMSHHHSGLISMAQRSVAMTEVIANQAMVTEVVNNHLTTGGSGLGEMVASHIATPSLIHVATDELGNPMVTTGITSPVASRSAHFTMATPQRTNPIKGETPLLSLLPLPLRM